MHSIVAELLSKRGIIPEDQETFFHPDFSRDVHDGLLMKGMSEAVSRLKKAIASHETIGVFGDYDADGVPATALLVRGFKRLGVEVIPFIPTRESGYGLNTEAVQEIIGRGATLLITVDNGTVSEPEIKLLLEAGIETIVCDHHQAQEGHQAESALVILNPKQSGCAYPFKELCGCAIGWKLLWELYTELGENPNQLKWELDLVALSTVADMVPLIGENRVLVLYGLQVLHKTRNKGLKALIESTGGSVEKVSSGTIGFQLAPRLNAPSRMHSELVSGCNAPLELLITEDVKKAEELAEYLSAQNTNRKTMLEEHLAEAVDLAGEYKDNLSLVVYDSEWSTGVIGLVAGRLLELYSKPVLVLASEGGVIKGSVRSVNGVNAVELLTAGEMFLEKFGGHAKAAGFSLKKEANVADFRVSLENYMKKKGYTAESLSLACLKEADISLSLENVSLVLAEEIKQLEPFGIGFSTPIFETVCQFSNIRRVGVNGDHLSCILKQGENAKKAIAFRLGSVTVEEQVKYRITYSIVVEEWNNNQQVSCHITRIDPVHA